MPWFANQIRRVLPDVNSSTGSSLQKANKPPLARMWRLDTVTVGIAQVDHLVRDYQGVSPVDTVINNAIDDFMRPPSDHCRNQCLRHCCRRFLCGRTPPIMSLLRCLLTMRPGTSSSPVLIPNRHTSVLLSDSIPWYSQSLNRAESRQWMISPFSWLCTLGTWKSSYGPRTTL